MKTGIQFFSTLKPFFEVDDNFWYKTHGPKDDDDEVKMEIFEEKSYTLFYSELKYKMIYSILGVFFNIEAIFRLS